MSLIRASMFNLIITIFCLTLFFGCEKEGPAEKAGKKIDSTIKNAEQSLEKAGEQIDEPISDAKRKIEDAQD